ncbi:MAG: DUF5615 family PIN-like protein [Bacteroidetes bacterium]|nr:DUF5615 family PIN-like protein [Bacteroidota bacterium]
MKILLDENIPKVLKKHLGKSFRIFTVQEMDWDGKRNGELLGLMIANDFEILITADKNLHFQQSLKKFPVAVLLLDLKFVRPDTVVELAPSILKVLKTEPEMGIIFIR